jgi:hypothetical protein
VLSPVLSELHYEAAPAAQYPYAVISETASKVGGRTFVGSYWEDRFYRISLFSADEDQAANLGAKVTTALDVLDVNPLTFDNGYQLFFHRTGDELLKMRGTGTQGKTFIWIYTFHYHARIGRNRT